MAVIVGNATEICATHGVQWTIELDDDVLGALDDPRSEDMFWRSYSVRGDLRVDAPLRDDELWSACRFRFRCRCCGATAPNPFCGGLPPFVRNGRVWMRGLLLPSATTRRERIGAWFRRLFC
jgi:hypothetical protein